MRRVEPFTDRHRDGLFALYERIFGAGKAERFQRRFDWQYVRNPYAREGQVTNWILTSDACVVGHLGVVPIDLKVGNARLHSSWICDYMVDAPHRFGPELSTLRASASDSSELPMGYGMPDHVARSYVKLNWKRVAVGSVLVKVLRLRAVACMQVAPRSRGPAGRAGVIATRVASLPRWCRHYLGLRRRQRPSGCFGDVAVRAAFDDSFDRLWEQVASAYPVAVERNCKYLDWRFRLGGRDGARLIVLEGEATPRGFALIEKVRWRGIVVGLISELIFSPEREDDAACLLAFAEQLLRKERVSAMVTEGFPARVRRTLLRHGFIEETAEKANATFFDRFGKCPEPLVEDVENWLLTPGDSDRSLGYPRAAWRDTLNA